MFFNLDRDHLKFLIERSEFGNQQKFSEAIELNEVSLSRLVTGKSRPTASTVRKMAVALGIDESELLLKVPRSLVQSEADNLLLAHFAELEAILKRSEDLCVLGGVDEKDFKVLQAHQNVVISNLAAITALAKVGVVFSDSVVEKAEESFGEDFSGKMGAMGGNDTGDQSYEVAE